jgi:hypothetical protein
VGLTDPEVQARGGGAGQQGSDERCATKERDTDGRVQLPSVNATGGAKSLTASARGGNERGRARERE